MDFVKSTIGYLVFQSFVLVCFMVLLQRMQEIVGINSGIEDKREMKLLCGWFLSKCCGLSLNQFLKRCMNTMKFLDFWNFWEGNFCNFLEIMQEIYQNLNTFQILISY